MGERQVGTVRVAGLDQRDLRLIGFVLRHSLYNRFDYRLEGEDAPESDPHEPDLALANPREPAGARLFAMLDAAGARSERIELVARGAVATHTDTVALDRLAVQLLPALNRAFERRLAARASAAEAATRAEAESADEAEAESADEAEAETTGETTGAAVTEAACVLVVDDSPTVRRQLGIALDRLGLRHESVGSAEQALERLAVGQFDLALVDVVMPGTDGYRLTREIRRDRRIRHLPVIILTSRSSPFDLARGALAGCDAYLTKPVPFRALETAVRKQLRRAPRGAARETGASPSGDTGAGFENTGASRLARLLGR